MCRDRFIKIVNNIERKKIKRRLDGRMNINCVHALYSNIFFDLIIFAKHTRDVGNMHQKFVEHKTEVRKAKKLT